MAFSELTVNKSEIGRITVEYEGLSNLAPALLIISQIFSVEGTDEYVLHNCSFSNLKHSLKHLKNVFFFFEA